MITPQSRRRTAALVLATIAGAVGPCAAQTFTLIRTDLSRHRVHGPLFMPGQVHFADANGQPILVPNDELLALLAFEPFAESPPEGSLGEEPVGMLTLTDGRVLFGRAVESSDDSLVWETMLRDRLSFPLEQIRTISTSARRPVRPTSSLDDRVVLENADELTGFVLAYRPLVEIETDSGVRSIEPQLVRGVELANPVSTSRSTLVALTDGSVLACSQIASTEEGEVVLTDAATHGEMQISSDDLVGILWRPSSAAGLSSLGTPEVAPPAGLQWIDPPTVLGPAPVGVGDLRFSGPSRASWSLPEGATDFSALVELPAATRPWGECEVVVLVGSPAGDREVASIWLDSENPAGELRASLSGADTLIIEVREGKLGPVADTPVLRAPILLLDGS